MQEFGWRRGIRVVLHGNSADIDAVLYDSSVRTCGNASIMVDGAVWTLRFSHLSSDQNDHMRQCKRIPTLADSLPR